MFSTNIIFYKIKNKDELAKKGENMEKYISKKEKASYGFAAVGSYMVAGITQSYLMYFFTDILIIPSAFVMMLMIVARVWDALNDPMMGVIVDRTSTKYGKMRPYVLIGSFLMLVTTIVLFMPLTGAPTMFKMIFAAVSYIIFGMAYTLTDVPAMGLMSVATPNSDERASLLSFYVTVGSVGSLLPAGLLTIFRSFIPEKYIYFAMSIFVGIITSAAYLTLFKNSKERFSTHTEKIAVRDMIKAAGKNKPMMMALLMSMAASPRYVIMPAALYIVTYVINIPGFNSFVTKFNNAVGFIGLSAALTLFHFIEPSAAGVPAVQSASTVTGLFSLVTVIPGIGFLLSLIPICFYNFSGVKKEKILSELVVKRKAIKKWSLNLNEKPLILTKG